MKKLLCVLIAIVMLAAMPVIALAAPDVGVEYAGNMEYLPGVTYSLEIYLTGNYDDFEDDYRLGVDVLSGKSYMEFIRVVKVSSDEYTLQFKPKAYSSAGTRDTEFEVYIADRSNGDRVASSGSDTITIGYGSRTTVNDPDHYVYNVAPVIRFDPDLDHIMLHFENNAAFDVRLYQQSQVNLAIDTSVIKEIEVANQSATLEFMNFVANPSFDFVGTLYYPSSTAKYAYQITSSGLKKLNATLGSGSIMFNTSQLGSYVFSNKPLNGASTASADPTKPAVPTTGEDGKNNPAMGAANLFGSIAVVGMMAITATVLGKKK